MRADKVTESAAKALQPEQLDIAANRRARKYSNGEMARRLCWMAAWPFFRFSPRPAFAWRRFLLRLMGARVGANVHIYPSATIYFPWMLVIGDKSAIGEGALIYNLGQVTIGRGVTISHQAHLCAGTHDYLDPALPLLRPPIDIGDEAWICADAFVGPGVQVGAGAVVGARAVALRDVEPWTVVVGNPAQYVKRREMRQSVEESRVDSEFSAEER